MYKVIILIFINCLLLVTGQILWKTGLKKTGLQSITDYINLIINPYIFSGLAIYGFATVLWFYILKNNDLTKIYSLQSMSYIIALFFGYFFLNETISINTIVGTVIICAGITVMYW